jgi:hypothetical protein
MVHHLYQDWHGPKDDGSKSRDRGQLLGVSAGLLLLVLLSWLPERISAGWADQVNLIRNAPAQTVLGLALLPRGSVTAIAPLIAPMLGDDPFIDSAIIGFLAAAVWSFLERVRKPIAKRLIGE